MVEMDKSYKPCSLVDTDKMYKMCSLEEDRLYNGLCGSERRNESPSSSSHKNPRAGNLGGVVEEQHTETPRQMKYNISHTFASPGETDRASASYIDRWKEESLFTLLLPLESVACTVQYISAEYVMRTFE